MFFSVLLCLISGAVYSAAFPPVDTGFTAWFAFIPFFFACAGKSRNQKLVLGFIAGTSAFSLNLYWLYATIRFTGESAALSFSAVILSGAFFALFTALWALLSEEKSVYVAAAGVLLSWLGSKIPWSVPWCPLYVSQASYTVMLQICSIAGPYFLTFLIIYTNHSLYRVFGRGQVRHGAFTTPPLRDSGQKQVPPLRDSGTGGIVSFLQGKNQPVRTLRDFARRKLLPLMPAFVLVAATVVYGFYKVSAPASGAAGAPWRNEYEICVVQPRILQDIKWDRKEIDGIKEKIKFFTAASSSADLTVFPESVLPGIINYDPEMDAFVSEIEKIKKTPSVLGAAVYSLEKNKTGGFRQVLKNGAMLLNGDKAESAPWQNVRRGGRARQFYFKRKLVPFGEFVPFRKILGRFIKVINVLGDFERGQKAEILKAGPFRIIPLICSESVYPGLWRGDGNIAVNITNDAWFGKTAAAEQHLRHVIVGAVSFGLPAVFANNTGPSALIDSKGRVIRRSAPFEECSFTEKVQVPERRSFYGRNFDITLASSGVIAAYALLMIFRRRFEWIKIYSWR